MYRLVYVSSATHLMSKPELIEILEVARRNNTRLGVTGMLLYRDGNFIQLLEGDQDAVKNLYATIEQDSRHFGSMVLLEEDTDERLFSEWSMGFRDLSDPALQDLPGFSPFMNRPLTIASFQNDPAEAMLLLELFREGR